MADIALYKIAYSFVVIFLVLWNTGVYCSYMCPEACSCLGSMVDCSKRGLQNVPNDLPVWVEILDLSSNSIADVELDMFKDLVKLEELDISNNKIKQLNTRLFANCPKLKILKLSYNDFEEIPSFPPSCNLTQLLISHNKIRILNASAFENVPRLRQLDLGFNKISSLLNGSFPFLPNLHQLYLNNNRINRMRHGSLDSLPNLEWLKLGKNQIPELPKEMFKRLTQLKHLDLNKNKLRVIVGLTFHGLGNLVTLKLKRNNITALQDGAFWGLSKIQTLELDNNSLTQVMKSGLYGLESLKSLSITNNRITKIENGSWEFCEHLVTLDLSNNNMVRIDSETFSKLKSLDGLWLNNNQISYIGTGAFKHLSTLTTLELNNNQISWTIEDMHGPFEGLASLTRLSLESNQVKSVTKKAFQGLDQLKQLDLGHNQISTLQNNAFADLMELKRLNINTTALLCDCELMWFPNWLRDVGFDTTVSAKCEHPSSLHGRNVMDVKEFTCDEFPKPVIETSPATQIALKGNNITLHCVAWSSSKSLMKIEWRKDNIAVTQARSNTTATMIEGGTKMTSMLMISNVQDEHAGYYQCIATNDVGPTYSEKAEIKVHAFPAFTKKPVDIKVKAGDKIQLECAATGQPVPEISWQKDGGDDFPAARERRMHIEQDNDKYLISSVKTEDMGVYSCMASNAAGTVVANATLTVLEIPEFAEPMADKEVQEGDTAVLECMAQGSPKPWLSWKKDGKAIETLLTERHFFTADDQLLIIVEAKPEDSGKYTCTMTNSLGTASDSLELKITRRGGGIGSSVSFFSDNTTTTGIIIIAVVCCVVGTSLIWVVIIYQTRRKNEEYSSTPTEETTIPEVAYNSESYTRTIFTAQGAYSKVYMNGGTHIKNGGVHMNGGFNITRNPMENEEWDAGQGEFEQDSREPLVASVTDCSNNGSNRNCRQFSQQHEPRCSSSSISVASCSSSVSSSCSCSNHSSSSSLSPAGATTRNSTIVLSTFHPYPLGNNPACTSTSSSTALVRNNNDSVIDSNVNSQLSTATTTTSSSPSSSHQSHCDPMSRSLAADSGGICHPTMLQEGSPQCATFPRPHSTYVPKTSSCSEIQPNGQNHTDPHHDSTSSNHKDCILKSSPSLKSSPQDKTSDITTENCSSTSSNSSCRDNVDSNHNTKTNVAQEQDSSSNDCNSNSNNNAHLLPHVIVNNNSSLESFPNHHHRNQHDDNGIVIVNENADNSNNNNSRSLSPVSTDSSLHRQSINDIAHHQTCSSPHESSSSYKDNSGDNDRDTNVMSGGSNSQTDRTSYSDSSGLLDTASSSSSSSLSSGNNNNSSDSGLNVGSTTSAGKCRRKLFQTKDDHESPELDSLVYSNTVSA